MSMQSKRLALGYLQIKYEFRSGALTNEVQSLLCQLLPCGQCGIETVADRLAMHPRTLQRRLAKEKKRYEEILDVLRQEMATLYLSEAGMQMSEIAGRLGYTEQSTFSRACRRWFGVPPREFREQICE